MTFGQHLRKLREAAGLTQAQLGEKVGVHRESIARLEADKHDPGWSIVQALAKALGVECTALTDTAPPKRQKNKV